MCGVCVRVVICMCVGVHVPLVDTRVPEMVEMSEMEMVEMVVCVMCVVCVVSE